MTPTVNNRSRITYVVTALLLGVLAFSAVLFTHPRRVYADAFDISQTTLKATVQPNGDLSVTELRTFEFNDDGNGVFWTLPYNNNAQQVPATYTIQGITETASDGSTLSFAQVPYADNGASQVYTVEDDSDGLEIKVFRPFSDGDVASLTLSYTITGAVMAWPDTAELYWQFVGPNWESDSNNVSLTIQFAGALDSAQSSDELRAWGHGPLDGTVTPYSDVPSVVYEVPRVDAGEFAEARVTFPTSWVPALAVPNTAVNTTRMPTILEEEQSWADEANTQRERAHMLVLMGTVEQIGFPLAILIAVIACYLTIWKNPRPRFQETYYREIPSSDHPAVLAAFMNNGTIPEEAFTATLMKLTNDGVIELNTVQTVEDGLFRDKVVESYVLRIKDASRVKTAIDQAALDFYFGDSVFIGSEVLIDQLSARASADPKAYQRRLDHLKDIITTTLKARQLVDGHGGVLRAALGTLLTISVVISLILFVMSEAATLSAFALGLVLSAIAGILLSRVHQYSREGVELRARLEALKRWFEDFTRLNEAPPQDVVLWNEMLVMAVALGVSDEVVRQLADAVPVDRRGTAEAGYYYPIYWWFYPHAHLTSPINVTQSAYRASVSELTGSQMSSGIGGGGGFSFGGGGGVGGGGGGSF